MRSETWLIEVKRQQQQEADVSLFLAMDIPKGIAKALFLPESVLERERQTNPTPQGIVLTDRKVVSALLLGDLEGKQGLHFFCKLQLSLSLRRFIAYILF